MKDSTKSFTFSFNAQGRIIFPQEFKDFLIQHYSNTASILKLEETQATTIEGFLGASSRRLSLVFQKKLDQLRASRTKNNMLEHIRTALRPLEVSIDGPTLDELLSGLTIQKKGNELLLYWPGLENNKNDFITISAEFNTQQFMM